MDIQGKGINGVERNQEERGKNWSLIGLRTVAMVLTLVATIVLGVNKQTKVVPVTTGDSLPPMYVSVHARWRYLSTLVYFVVANAIASAYAAVSLVSSMGGKKKSMGFIVLTLDLLMVALLFSSTGAITAIGLMGYKGNSHVGWNKVCNVFGRFCHQAVASVVLSLLASLAFVLLVLLSALRRHKRHI